jgi:uncharacterized membrane protein YedE/YeeE
MMEWLSQPWPWYVAGPIIGLFVPLLLLIGNKPLGATTSLRAMCAGLVPTRTSGGFLDYDWKRIGGWNIAFVVGIGIGAFIASRLLPHDTSALAPAASFSWSALLTVRGVVSVVVGGFLAGFGATYAGGCTSGHGITGLASMQLASLIAVMAIFAGGIAATFLILPLIL